MNRRAFSMVEVAISSLVLGLMMASALNATGLSARIRGGQTAKSRALIICTELMSEMRAAPLPADPTTLPASATPGSRSSYDDLFDFAHYMAAPPVNASGVVIPGAEGWWVRVVMAWVEPDDLGRTSVPYTGVLRVHVSVRRGQLVLAELDTIRTIAGEAARVGSEP